MLKAQTRLLGENKTRFRCVFAYVFYEHGERWVKTQPRPLASLAVQSENYGEWQLLASAFYNPTFLVRYSKDAFLLKLNQLFK